MRSLSISVLVPTYRRSSDLARCLDAIARQRRQADQVIVVCRDDDFETNALLSSSNDWPFPLHISSVGIPGQVAALNAGLCCVESSIVAITDDDAAPRTDWLFRIEDHFSRDLTVGGVGGRDYVYGSRPEKTLRRVGVLQWFGRRIGNHHRGTGAAREVHFLKGANMSFRMEAVGDARFDSRLRGSGAQVHNDFAFSLSIRQCGWKLVYDPAVAVDHYPAQRFDEDQRTERSQAAVSASAYNETLTILEHLPVHRRAAFWVWALLAGTGDLPGLLQCLRPGTKGAQRRARLRPMLSGRFAAAATAGKRSC